MLWLGLSLLFLRSHEVGNCYLVFSRVASIDVHMCVWGTFSLHVHLCKITHNWSKMNCGSASSFPIFIPAAFPFLCGSFHHIQPKITKIAVASIFPIWCRIGSPGREWPSMVSLLVQQTIERCFTLSLSPAFLFLFSFVLTRLNPTWSKPLLLYFPEDLPRWSSFWLVFTKTS